MENFEGIIEFVTVAESQGFSAAAKKLGCSTSHISRQISRLEERLGAVLLARTTRQVSLTQSGMVYYEQCRGLIDGLQQANEQITNQQVQLQGTLRVSGAGLFVEQFVAPALMEFALNHPDLKIDMDFNSRMVNFIEDGFDFAIRYGQLADSSLVARKLLDRSMIAAASPAYLEKFGTPQEPADLKDHSCLIANNDTWLFSVNGAQEQIKVNGRWQSNNVHVLTRACEQGFGIAYMPRSSFFDLIEKGRLTPVLQSYWVDGLRSWIVYQNRRFLPMRARLAIDYLVDYFTDWEE